MEDYLIEGEILTDIADKIRENAPETYEGSTITPEEMPEAVEEVWEAGYNEGIKSVDLSPYQTKHDENLETDSKEIPEAINEVNRKKVDKIKFLEQNQKVSDVSYGDQYGIYISNKTRIMNLDEDVVCEPEFDQYIPIVAGENVTFEVDEENQVVKINVNTEGIVQAVLASLPNAEGVEF